MKTRACSSILVTTLLALAIPLSAVAAQEHHHYKLIDLGTFGGPQSYTVVTTVLNTGLDLNNSGVLVGFADTTTPAPSPPLCFVSDCMVPYAFQWRGGARTGLDSLLRGWGSAPVAVSSNGLVAGFSENGVIDPLTGAAVTRAVLWRDGHITDLGALPEGYESGALAVNSAGQVVGAALNAVPDPNSLMIPGVFLVQTTQLRAFLWEQGVMRDLGTLGGNDALAALVNESAHIVGWSYTSTTQPGACEPYALGSFIWDKEHGMRNLGSFGGTCTFAYGLNNQGQVVGWSSTSGDQQSRAFLWQDGDFTELGGDFGGFATGAYAVNEAGQAAGFGYLAGEIYFHAALWTHIGQIIDLGTVDGDPCSSASAINARGQVVGNSISLANCLGTQDPSHPFLWENGSIVDLNAVIPVGSALYLIYPDSINDRGEIAGDGVDACGNQHAFLLIPCDDGHPNVEGCDYSLVDAAPAAPAAPAA